MKFTVLVLLLLLIIILIIIIIAIIIKMANMDDVVIMIKDFVDESVSVKMLFSPFLFSLSMMSVNSSISDMFDVSFNLFPVLESVLSISLKSRKW